MATKRKTKTEVTYVVEWGYGDEWSVDPFLFTGRLKALQYARTEARATGVDHRIVRVEKRRTVVAEVKP